MEIKLNPYFYTFFYPVIFCRLFFLNLVSGFWLFSLFISLVIVFFLNGDYGFTILYSDVVFYLFWIWLSFSFCVLLLTLLRSFIYGPLK